MCRPLALPALTTALSTLGCVDLTPPATARECQAGLDCAADGGRDARVEDAGPSPVDAALPADRGPDAPADLPSRLADSALDLFSDAGPDVADARASLPPGLVGYWMLDEGSGTTIKDSSGYGNDGTTIQNPLWSTSIPPAVGFVDQHSLNLVASQGQYALVPNRPSLNPTSAISVCAWVNATSWGSNPDFRHILQKGLNNQYRLLEERQQIAWYVAVNGQERWVGSSTAPSTGQWHHVAGTYDGATVRLYIDGVSVGTPVDIAGALATTTDDLGIGVKPDGFAPFDGLIDEVRIYDRALSAQEIGAQYAGQQY